MHIIDLEELRDAWDNEQKRFIKHKNPTPRLLDLLSSPSVEMIIAEVDLPVPHAARTLEICPERKSAVQLSSGVSFVVS